jgi:hypothetical protein
VIVDASRIIADAITSLAIILAYNKSVGLRIGIFSISRLLTRVVESHLYLRNIELSRLMQSSGRI